MFRVGMSDRGRVEEVARRDAWSAGGATESKDTPGTNQERHRMQPPSRPEQPRKHVIEEYKHKAQTVTLTTTAIDYKTGGPIPVTHKTLHRDVHAGHRILFDDGTIEVKVERVRGKNIIAKVTVPGVLKSHKGMNLPDSTIDADPFTAKDRDDLLFGVENGVDWVVLSFVTCADDIKTARSVSRAAARAYGVRPPKIMALMGTPLGFSHSGEIEGHCAAGAVKRLLG